MAVTTVRIQSEALERPVHYTVLLPKAARVGPGPYPVLVQMHGYWDDYCAWLYKSNLLRYVEDLPLIVVLPDGANGWWANFGQSLKYEDFVVHDLWAHVQATFPARESRWAIGGLSMGGYGAIRLGLKHPDKYCSIFAHSSPLPTRGSRFVWSDSRWSKAFQAELKADLDCYRWAREVDRAMLPRLGFDCGTEDGLLESNRRFHAFLKEIDLPHSYAEHPGAHTWDYWDRHVQTALRQHAEVLDIQPVAEQ